MFPKIGYAAQSDATRWVGYINGDPCDKVRVYFATENDVVVRTSLFIDTTMFDIDPTTVFQ